MTPSHLDPMQDNTRRLAQALTTARSSARSSDGLLMVEACADGQVEIRIDDRALRYGGAAVAGELTRLAAQALSSARVEVREAAAAFSADPRIAAMVTDTEDAMNLPMNAGGARPDHDVRPTEGVSSQSYSSGTPDVSTGRGPQPPGRPVRAPASHIPYDLYDDAPYDDGDEPDHRPRSWLV